MAKVQKKKVSKSKGKSAKSKIEKLNADLKEIESIKSLVGVREKTNKVLDAKKIKEDLTKQKEDKERNKKAESELEQQLEMLTGMGL
ncbi:hypothetical protein CLIB1444_12S01156 [[Candida] jaroonii]|uniref:Uncharacterized protein n=1 Tax=[Candida] jaroonii TaxID=467808 RepID=A0ACA9YD33_9ASCO|nr:hypothetical protein CLIB1444_12S01156 [[Candida] jaroonii]